MSSCRGRRRVLRGAYAFALLYQNCNNGPRTAVALPNGNIAVGDETSMLYVIDGDDGGVVWSREMPGPIVSAPAVALGGAVVIVGTQCVIPCCDQSCPHWQNQDWGGAVVAVNASTARGATLWITPVEQPGITTSVCAPVVTMGFVLMERLLEAHRVLQRTVLRMSVTGCVQPVTDANGGVYVSGPQHLYALSSSGARLWYAWFGGQPANDMAIGASGNGMLYIAGGGSDTPLYAVAHQMNMLPAL